MSDFFEISAADEDGYGMMMQYNESGGQGLSGLWASRMRDGRFNMDIFPWREAEAKALKRTDYLTIVQRRDPTDFIDPDPISRAPLLVLVKKRLNICFSIFLKQNYLNLI